MSQCLYALHHPSLATVGADNNNEAEAASLEMQRRGLFTML